MADRGVAVTGLAVLVDCDLTRSLVIAEADQDLVGIGQLPTDLTIITSQVEGQVPFGVLGSVTVNRCGE